jgi:hypothetical protein
MTGNTKLARLGWRQFFQQQLTLDEVEHSRPARVLVVQRSGITVADEVGERHLAVAGKWFTLPSEQRPSVGDWLLLNSAGEAIERVLAGPACSLAWPPAKRPTYRHRGQRRHALRRRRATRSSIRRASNGILRWL